MELPISNPETRKKALYLIDNYKRLGIYIRPVKFEAMTLYIQVEQKQFVNDKILSSDELKERVSNLFENRLDSNINLTITNIY